MVRQGNLTVEDEKLKHQFPVADGILLAVMEPASKLDDRCATQASKWGERQELIRDTIKLLKNDDGLELLKAILSSPTQMQLQNDKGGVARRARAALRRQVELHDPQRQEPRSQQSHLHDRRDGVLAS